MVRRKCFKVELPLTSNVELPLTSTRDLPLYEKWRALPRSYWRMLSFPPEMEARWGNEQVRRQKFMVRMSSVVLVIYLVIYLVTYQREAGFENGKWFAGVSVLILSTVFSCSLTFHPGISYDQLEIVSGVGCLLIVVMITLVMSNSRQVVLQEDDQAILNGGIGEAFYLLIQALITVTFHAGSLVRARRAWLVTCCSVFFVIIIQADELLFDCSFLVYRLNYSSVEVWAVDESETTTGKIDAWLQLRKTVLFFLYSVLGVVCWSGQCLQETAQRTAFERMVALEVANEAQRREAAVQHKRDRDLAATIFHEVRNPLNGVVAHLRLGWLLKREAAAAAAAAACSAGGPDALDEHISGALGSAEVAIEFLNTLTQVEKLDASAATLHPTRQQLGALLERSANVVRAQLQPGVTLRTQLPPAALVVLVDGTVLTQVLINLLSNAVRHTCHGTITLACVPVGANQGLGRFQFSVSDTGSGVAHDIKDNLFDRYRSIGGVGLGLHLTYRQVKSMGATIEVESPVAAAAAAAANDGAAPPVDGGVSGRSSSRRCSTSSTRSSTSSTSSSTQHKQQGPGTRFHFVIKLPLIKDNLAGANGSGGGAEATNGGGGAVANGTAEGRPAGGARNGAATNGAAEMAPLPEGLRVLVSDDVKTNRKLLRAAFERHCDASWSVSEARSGEEAIAMCEATPFDLIVMDEVFEAQGGGISANGPDQRLMLGSEAIAQIRRGEAEWAKRYPEAAARPASIISCSGNNAGTDHVVPTGADLVWTKPFPDFTNGEMQRQLSKLLARWLPAPAAGLELEAPDRQPLELNAEELCVEENLMRARSYDASMYRV